jgi:hypothetical protein
MYTELKIFLEVRLCLKEGSIWMFLFVSSSLYPKQVMIFLFFLAWIYSFGNFQRFTTTKFKYLSMQNSCEYVDKLML